jgi:hypothetical protein
LALLAYTLVFFFVYSTVEIHRHGFDKAFYDWYKNRNAETEAALKREQHLNDVARLQDGAIGAAILVTVGYGAWAMVRIARRKLR